MALDGGARGNLRAPSTPFIGRANELGRALELAREPARLLLITGPAGVGKSRLALEAAGAWLAAQEAGGAEARALHVELSAALALEPALRRIGIALGLAFDPAETTDAAVQRVADVLALAPATLLVLDDADAALSVLHTALARWLRAAPSLRVLVTSRRELPEGLRHARLELSPLREDDALALFLDRTRRVRPDFELSPGQEPALRELLARVDALPLAIELLAPRLRLLSPRQLLARFDAAEGPGRPLAQAISRSWELLSPVEREVLAQSTVFRDGFDLGAAEAVIALPAQAGAPDVWSVLEALAAQSLLRTTTLPQLPDEVRIQHFRSVQEFAHEHLADAGRAEQRHAAYFLREGERWDAGVESPAELECTHRLMIELPNLEAAFGRAREPEAVARLGLLLHFAYQRRGPFGGQAELCERVVSAARASGRAGCEARGLLARARVARWNGDLAQALADLGAARELAARAGDVVTEAACLRNQAACHFRAGAVDEAAACIDAALEAGRRGGRDSDLINAQNGAGHVWTLRGNFARAEQALVGALGLARRAQIPGLIALVTSSLAELMLRQERLSEAEHYADEAVAAYASLHYLRQLLLELLARARVRALADRPGARDDATRAFAMASQLGLRPSQVRARTLLGQIAFYAADFAGAHTQLERALDEASPEPEPELRAYAAATRAALGHLAPARELFAALGRKKGKPTPAHALLHAFLQLAEGAPREPLAQAARDALARGDAETKRIAAALLEHLFGGDSPAQAARSVRLELSPDARRFRIAPHAAVDLTRRRALWGVLRCLVERHATRPGSTVALAEVLEAGWPGERMGGDSGTRRVYVTVNRLRRAGLGDLILTTGDGYMLAPHVDVVRRTEWR